MVLMLSSPSLTFGSSAWYFSLIPINMAIGSIRVLITLVVLSLGGNLFDVGFILAANAIVTIVMSIAWGKVSDYFGLRIRFLLVCFLFSAPIFALMGLAGAVWQLIAMYTILAVFSSGIQPIAAMYAVEYREGKNWQGEVIKYNYYWNSGVIVGLVVNTLLALVLPLPWILYLASVFCLVSTLILWRTAKEPMLPLERDAYPIVNLQDEEEPTAMSVLDYIDLRRINIPRTFRRLKPIHLLFLACLIHWTGVYTYGVGEVPFMSAIGLSASVILGITVIENIAAVGSFAKIVPRVHMEYGRLIKSMMAFRAVLILIWSGLTVFLVYPVSFAGVFPLILLILFLVCYALVWYPIMCFAISQAQPNRRGTTQGQLLSVVSLANVLGSLIGGFLIGAFGYAVGFAVAAGIAVLALPILYFVNVEIKAE